MTRISETVTAMKAAMVGFEMVAFVLLVRLLAARGAAGRMDLVYAWHPLPLWEFAGSGHIDAALIALSPGAAGAGRPGSPVLRSPAATLVKIYPAVLFPAL